jgi:hypothetical protein
MDITDFTRKFKTLKGKSNGYPSFFDSINYENKRLIINANVDKKNFREIDPWTLVIFEDFKTKTKINSISLVINLNYSARNLKTYLEEFKQRMSFIALNNKDINIEIYFNNKNVSLYKKEDLFKPKSNEILRDKINTRNADDKEGRLEKDFQAFLFGGKGKTFEERTNARLAILGDDFFKVKKENLQLIREFPTGVFDSRISNETRLQNTFYIDIVTLNKYKELSIIELKLDDPKLEVISQILDYALFFRRYLNQLKKLLFDFKGNKINCYFVNNRYHSNFSKITKYYHTEGKNYGFELIQLTLGYTKRI